jgi:hypothetical protein
MISNIDISMMLLRFVIPHFAFSACVFIGCILLHENGDPGLRYTETEIDGALPVHQ